jgi:hypothetical protein
MFAPFSRVIRAVGGEVIGAVGREIVVVGEAIP